jgi:outer membrane receptor protein involved in Fe transport
MPGSNPLYGLNTLGGALSLETKTGFSDPGAEVHVLGGSFGRRLIDFGLGGHGERWGLFAAGRYFGEEGWRPFSPSRTASAFVAGTYQNGATTAELSLAAADTTLNGNGPAPRQLLAANRRAIFTYPDITDNQMFMAVARGERPLSASVLLSGVAYFRASRIATLNGDQADWLACQDPAQAGFVCTAEEGGGETPVLDDAGTPVPYDTMNPYDAAENTTRTRQQSAGVAAQVAIGAPIAGRENHLFVGAAANEGRAGFTSQSALARLTQPDRGTMSSGIVDAASRVAVDSVSRDLGLYASDTLALRRDLFVTAAARFNLSTLSLEDRLGGALGGDHSFHRLNPALGVSYQPLTVVGGYAGYSESMRVPTPLELTCASETDPCRLPNGFISDPPLAPVVARTFELGVRGRWKRPRTTLDYVVAAFRTTNADDILFISSGAVANRGYFANVGDTRRQGVEASLLGRRRFGGGNARVEWAIHYTYLDARFLTAFRELSANHPDAVGGSIDVPAGARIPSVPAHIGKAVVTWFAGAGISAGVDVVANGGQVYRGDEANRLALLPGYVVVNLRGAYQVARPVSLFAIVSNLFDADYGTFGVLGNPAPVLGPTYTDPRFIGPGAPRALWVGVDVNY